MAKSKRKKIVKIILHVFGVLLFVFATSYALLAAYGYQIDLLERNIVKTSIIDLVGDYSDVTVLADEEEVAYKLPYQIKNIQPGDYFIEINSDEYRDWSKVVEVVGDYVTIVDDIYLIPEDLTLFTKSELLNILYSDFVFIDKYLVFINNEKGTIRKLNIENEEVDLQTITLLNPVEYNSLYTVGNRYIAFDNTDEISLFDIYSNKFITILVPDEFELFNLAYTSYLHGIYSNNGSIFAVDIDEEGVFNEITLLLEDAFPKVMKAYSEDGFIFVLSDENLYEYRDHLLTLIDENVNSKPKLSPDGSRILYLSNSGEIYIYSFENLEKLMVGRFVKTINSLDWFYDGKHIYINDGNLLFCDLTMDNCPVIIEDTLEKNIFTSKTKPLIVTINQEEFSRIEL